MGKTSIEWTDVSLNPIAAFEKYGGKRGWFCAHVSEGCRFCYAEAINRRFGNKLSYSAFNFEHVEFRVIDKILMEPFGWKKPLKCFSFDMTDWALIAERNPELMFDWFSVMRRTPHITYQMLTKRPKLALYYLHWLESKVAHPALGSGQLSWPWPFPNVWLGVSVEDQKTTDERIPILLQTPAAVRFVSYEPALGAVSVACYLRRVVSHSSEMSASALDSGAVAEQLSGLDWVIAGGESGPHARPSEIDWYRKVRDDCDKSGVAFFMKQITRRGRKIPIEEWPIDLRVREFPRAA